MSGDNDLILKIKTSWETNADLVQVSKDLQISEGDVFEYALWLLKSSLDSDTVQIKKEGNSRLKVEFFDENKQPLTSEIIIP